MLVQDFSNSKLHQVCKPVENFDSKIQGISSDMQDCLHNAEAYGLAAPQVDLDLRMFVMHTYAEENSRTITLINPEILQRHGYIYYEESCLSIKDLSLAIRRSQCVKVKYFDECGNSHVKMFYGYDAVCAQHEIDHLNGIMMFNYMTKEQLQEYKDRIDSELAKHLEL